MPSTTAGPRPTVGRMPGRAAGRPPRRGGLLGLYLSTPLLAGLTLVILVPEVIALGMSFTNQSPGLATRFVGLRNYATILTAGGFWNSVKVTVLFVVFGVAAQLALGLAVSLFLARCVRRTALLIAIVLLPSAVSPAVLGMVWKFLFDQDAGPVNYLLSLVGIGRVSWLADTLPAMLAVLITYTWHTVPQSVILLYPATAAVPRDLYEAATLDGAGRFTTLRRVVLPWIGQAMLVALVFRMMIAMRAFGEVYVLTQGGPDDATNIFGIYLYRLGFQQFRWGTAAAFGWVLLVATLLVAMPAMRGIARRMMAGTEAG